MGREETPCCRSRASLAKIRPLGAAPRIARLAGTRLGAAVHSVLAAELASWASTAAATASTPAALAPSWSVGAAGRVSLWCPASGARVHAQSREVASLTAAVTANCRALAVGVPQLAAVPTPLLPPT